MDKAAVKVDVGATKVQTRSKALVLTTEQALCVKGGDGISLQNVPGSVNFIDDVIVDDLLKHLLVGLVVIGDVLKSTVDGHEDGLAGLGVVQAINEVGEFINQFGELGSVRIFADGLVNSSMIGLWLWLLSQILQVLQDLVVQMLGCACGGIEQRVHGG